MDHPCPPSPGSFSPQLSHLVFGHFYCERQKNNFHPFLTPVSMKLFPYVRYLEQLQSSFYKSLQQKASVETSTPIGEREREREKLGSVIQWDGNRDEQIMAAWLHHWIRVFLKWGKNCFSIHSCKLVSQEFLLIDYYQSTTSTVLIVKHARTSDLFTNHWKQFDKSQWHCDGHCQYFQTNSRSSYICFASGWSTKYFAILSEFTRVREYNRKNGLNGNKLQEQKLNTCGRFNS